MKVLKIFEIAFYAFAALLFLWFTASYFDILANNCGLYPVSYQPWNLFFFMRGILL